MSKLRIGIVGLGNIAQKAWLPVLGVAKDWVLQGAFSPSEEKAKAICKAWRIPCFPSLLSLALECDAVFVHSSTQSHYEVVSVLLRAGIHVCVDKPLAQTLHEAEHLIALAAKQKRILMVGFNRRFAPRYRELKDRLVDAASIRMDKHRVDNVGPQDMQFTLLDDYIHVVDTALWLGGGTARLQNGVIQCNAQGQMQYAEHHFTVGKLQITTSMHRRAGSGRECVRAITDGGLFDVSDMWHWREECGKGVIYRPDSAPGNSPEIRGFTGCAHHFITCVANQTIPDTSGEQAIIAQRIVEKLWREAVSE